MSNKLEEPTRQVVAYTHSCNTVDENAKDVFAKKVVVDDKVTYWVISGMDGRLFNPYGIDGLDFAKAQTRNMISPRSMRPYTFKKVSETSFTHYLKFLATKADRWLSYAQRENHYG